MGLKDNRSSTADRLLSGRPTNSIKATKGTKAADSNRWRSPTGLILPWLTDSQGKGIVPFTSALRGHHHPNSNEQDKPQWWRSVTWCRLLPDLHQQINDSRCTKSSPRRWSYQQCTNQQQNSNHLTNYYFSNNTKEQQKPNTSNSSIKHHRNDN